MPATTFAPVFDNPNVFPLNTTGPQTRQNVKSAIADVAVGAAAGSTATANRTQVQHSDNATARDGGKMRLEVNADINRATTAQDVANLKAQLKKGNAASFGFVRDLSGNGGPAFTRSF